MAVTKIRKISSWTLLICSIVSIIILGMFFAGGVVDPAAELQEPIYTGLLIDWTSALFFATIISTVLFAIWQFLGLLKTNAKEALSSLAVLVLFVALLFVTYTVGDKPRLQRFGKIVYHKECCRSRVEIYKIAVGNLFSGAFRNPALFVYIFFLLIADCIFIKYKLFFIKSGTAVYFFEFSAV